MKILKLFLIIFFIFPINSLKADNEMLAKISSDIIDEYPKKPDEVSILLNFEKTNRLIGQEIPREEIKSILTLLQSTDFKALFISALVGK